MILWGVRCPNCSKKLGDFLEGVYETTCPRCKRRVHIERPVQRAEPIDIRRQ